MCGRFSQTADWPTLQSRFNLKVGAPTLKKRYNIAPGQTALQIIEVRKERRLAQFKWGLCPKWADPKLATRMINARAETVDEKRAYKGPFTKARCLVIADGFYEWKSTGPKSKTPYRFTLRDGRPFTFAGLYDNGTFTILTTEANSLVQDVHARMPVILSPDGEAAWLNTKTRAVELKSLLVPYRAEDMVQSEVSTRVNSPQNDDPEILKVTAEPPPQPKKTDQMELF
jgi:putative SOS response-associated peptidase YedK